MMLDDYGYEQRDRSRSSHGGVYMKLNITNCLALWKRFWWPSKKDIELQLAKAKRDLAAYEAWFSKPSGDKQ